MIRLRIMVKIGIRVRTEIKLISCMLSIITDGARTRNVRFF